MKDNINHILNTLNSSTLVSHLTPDKRPFSRTTWVNHSGFNEAKDDGVAVASSRPYANHLHFTPDRYHASLIAQFFYRLHALPSNQQYQSTRGSVK